MASQAKAIVKPELLVWARESIGLSLEEAAKKIGVTRDRLDQWESGASAPTVNQLRKASNAYKRPLAVFYLPEPPRTFDAIRDFRRLPERLFEKRSPELNLEIRRAHMRREIALELSEQLGYELPKTDFNAALTNNTESSAIEARRILGVRLEDQFAWRDMYEALNNWISAVEHLGILVFQTSAVALAEMRGFSIAQTPFPVVVINAQDSLRGRSFTLMHELAHILFNNGGLCDLEEDDYLTTEEQRFEVSSNQVAGSILVPTSAILGEEIVRSAKREHAWADHDLRFLAQKYSVSQEVILRRLVTLGLASKHLYRTKRNEYLKSYEQQARTKRRGFAPFHRVAIRDLGRSYIRLVLAAYREETINSADLSDFLGMRLKHVPKIEHEVIGFVI